MSISEATMFNSLIIFNWWLPTMCWVNGLWSHSAIVQFSKIDEFLWASTPKGLTWPVPLVVQELFTLPEHLSSPPVFSGVRVTRSLVLHVCFVDRFLFFCTFSFGHCVVCSSIYRFWLPLWYLQTLLKHDSQMTGYACRISTLVLIIHKCIITLSRNCNFQC